MHVVLVRRLQIDVMSESPSECVSPEHLICWNNLKILVFAARALLAAGLQ